MSILKAGVARADITPAVGALTSCTGVVGANPAVGIADKLLVKALVLDDGRTRAAIVTADVIDLGKKIVAETRERIEQMTGIPPACVMFAASHTHSGPITRRPHPDEGDNVSYQSYLDELVAKMSGAVAEADSRLAEVRIGVGEGLAPFNVNRWFPTPDGPKGAKWGANPEGPVDETLSVLRLDRPDGTPLVAVVNYAAHASVAGWGKYFSADYPGFLQEVLEKVYDGKSPWTPSGMTAMFLNGAAGDLKVKWIEEDGSVGFARGADSARRSGTVIAGAALSVMEQIETTEQNLKIRIASKEVDLPLLTLPSVDEVEKQLEARRKSGEDTTWEQRVLPSLRDGTAPTSIPGEVQLLRLGDEIALAAFPGELFVEIGLRVRRELPFKHLFVVGYANGIVGYLPSAESCRQDGENLRYECHKEFWFPAFFSEGAEPALVEAAKELAGVK